MYSAMKIALKYGLLLLCMVAIFSALLKEDPARRPSEIAAEDGFRYQTNVPIMDESIDFQFVRNSIKPIPNVAEWIQLHHLRSDLTLLDKYPVVGCRTERKGLSTKNYDHFALTKAYDAHYSLLHNLGSVLKQNSRHHKKCLSGWQSLTSKGRWMGLLQQQIQVTQDRFQNVTYTLKQRLHEDRGLNPSFLRASTQQTSEGPRRAYLEDAKKWLSTAISNSKRARVQTVQHHDQLQDMLNVCINESDAILARPRAFYEDWFSNPPEPLEVITAQLETDLSTTIAGLLSALDKQDHRTCQIIEMVHAIARDHYKKEASLVELWRFLEETVYLGNKKSA